MPRCSGTTAAGRLCRRTVKNQPTCGSCGPTSTAATRPTGSVSGVVPADPFGPGQDHNLIDPSTYPDSVEVVSVLNSSRTHVRYDGRDYAVSTPHRADEPVAVFPCDQTGKITGWSDVASGDTPQEALRSLAAHGPRTLAQMWDDDMEAS